MDRVTVAVHALVACLSWSVANVLTKYLLGTVEPFALLSMQVGASGLVILALAIGRHGVRRTASAWRYTFLGLLQPGAAYGLSTYGLRHTSASVEALVWALDPALVLFFAWIVLAERPNRWLLAALVTCFIGNLLVAIGETQSLAFDDSIFAMGLIAVGVVASAFYTVVLSRYSMREPVLPILLWNQVGGLTVFLFAMVAASEKTSGLSATALSTIALSGVLLHALPFVLLALLLRKISAGSIGLITPMVSILTVGLAYLFLGERLSMVQCLGAAIISFGTLMLSLAPKSRMKSLRHPPTETHSVPPASVRPATPC